MAIDVRTAAGSYVDELLDLWLAVSVEGHEADDRYLITSGAAATARTFMAQLAVGTLARDARAVAFWRSLRFGDWRVS